VRVRVSIDYFPEKAAVKEQFFNLKLKRLNKVSLYPVRMIHRKLILS